MATTGAMVEILRCRCPRQRNTTRAKRSRHRQEDVGTLPHADPPCAAAGGVGEDVNAANQYTIVERRREVECP